ncbi:hypothetical protein PaG_04046 [Moesziomyces aphidis]|uniref:J domain-containing protein n=1 Tax=Moesziomyces aphidis TaxID=84754 RepID=W3VMA9_MOEAP|nr:hypothetical protein PaG_04046 [Moesziomyces aphidis]
MKVDVVQATSLLTWWWLPSFGSQLLLNACYSLRLVTPPAADAHQRRNNHAQLARTAVIIGTLVYQLVNAALSAQPNYYQLLGLPLDVDGEGVKRSFRALARRYHPDKVGEPGEAIFIVLRKAHDALSDPVKRFAYDRFGAEVVEWKDCESARDFMRRGLTGLVGFYTINPAMYALFGWINGGGDGVSFWRLACLLGLLAAELCMLVAPEYPTWLAIGLPNTTIHDARVLAHTLFVNFFFASMQLGAALDVLEYGERGAPARGKARKAQRAQAEMEAVRVRTQTLEQASELICKTALHNFAREVQPFAPARTTGKEGPRQMSDEEEQLFASISQVLLSRSLVQQNPQPAQLAEQAQRAAKPEPKPEPKPDEQLSTFMDKEEPHEKQVQSEAIGAEEEPVKASDDADAIHTKQEPGSAGLAPAPDGEATVKVEAVDALPAEAMKEEAEEPAAVFDEPRKPEPRQATLASE